MALKLDILANTRQFVSEMKQAGSSVEDISENLDDLAKEGKQTSDKLEASFRDLARSAQRVKTDGTDKAKDGLNDFKSEADGTAREVAASFDGSAESIAGGFQEVAANALAGFGPIGAAAGLAAAVGIGFVTQELAKQEESTKRLKGYFSDAYQTAAEEGRKYIDAATIIAEANDIIYNPERAGEWKQLQEDALEIGLKGSDLALAQAGDQESLNKVIELTGAAYDDAKKKREDAGNTAITMTVDEEGRLLSLRDKYADLGKMHDENQAKYKDSQEVQKTLAQQTRDENKRTYDAGMALINGIKANATIPLKLTVDDRAWRAWTPGTKTAGVQIARQGGQGGTVWW